MAIKTIIEDGVARYEAILFRGSGVERVGWASSRSEAESDVQRAFVSQQRKQSDRLALLARLCEDPPSPDVAEDVDAHRAMMNVFLDAQNEAFAHCANAASLFDDFVPGQSSVDGFYGSRTSAAGGGPVFDPATRDEAEEEMKRRCSDARSVARREEAGGSPVPVEEIDALVRAGKAEIASGSIVGSRKSKRDEKADPPAVRNQNRAAR